jgi:hypothetical protein
MTITMPAMRWLRLLAWVLIIANATQASIIADVAGNLLLARDLLRRTRDVSCGLGLARAGPLFAVNAGGSAITSPNGTVFVAGNTVATGAGEVYINPKGDSGSIANAAGWELPIFNSMRYTLKPTFNLTYTLPLTGPTTNVVEVELLFAELDRGIDSDERVFDVLLNGELALSGFDIFKAAGGREKAARASFFLNLTSAEVVVTFRKIRRKNRPVISGAVCYNVSVAAESTVSLGSSPATTTPVITTTATTTPELISTISTASTAQPSTSTLGTARTTLP